MNNVAIHVNSRFLSGMMVLVLLLIGSFETMKAQAEYTPKPEKPGVWKYEYKKNDYEAAFKMSAGEALIFRSKLKAISEEVRKDSIFAEPKGIEPHAAASVLKAYEVTLGDHSKARIQGEIDIELCEWYTINGKEKLMTMEVPAVIVTTNYPAATFNGLNGNFKSDGYDDKLIKATDALNELFGLPAVLKDLGNGVNLYENNVIVIAHNKKPYWVPVTIKEYFDRLLTYYRALKHSRDSAGSTYLLSLVEKEKEGLADKMNEPAWYAGGESIAGITAKELGGSKPVMKFNPAYFNASLPRTAVQLICISGSSNISPSEDIDANESTGTSQKALWNFMHTLDGKATQAVLDTR